MLKAYVPRISCSVDRTTEMGKLITGDAESRKEGMTRGTSLVSYPFNVNLNDTSNDLLSENWIKSVEKFPPITGRSFLLNLHLLISLMSSIVAPGSVRIYASVS